MNYNAVTAFQILAQPMNYMENSVIYIDDIAVGDNGVSGQAAVSSPYFLGFPNQDLYINSSSKTLRIMNAVDAAHMNSELTFSSKSSNPSILPDPTFSNSPFLSNKLNNFVSGNGSSGKLLSSRPVYMNLTPASNQYGMVTVTVTATVPMVSTMLGSTTVMGTITLTGTPAYQTPASMTSNIPDNFPNEEVIKLSDGDVNNKWLMNSNTGNAVVQFVTPKAINAYELFTANDAEDRDPVSWTVEASNTNNGSDWVTLSTISNGNLPVSRNTTSGVFKFNNATSYSYYKWNILSTKGATMMQVSELKWGMAASTGTTTGPITVSTVLSVVGASSTPYSYIFTANVKRNTAPTIGILPSSLTIGSDKNTELAFDNIFSGNGEINQNMTITGTSSDQSVISNSQIVVSFSGIGTTAKAFIKPVSFAILPLKTATITFTISDNGGTALGGSNQTQYTIPVSIYPTYFNTPSFNVIESQIDNVTNQGPRTITILGITDGNGAARIASLVAVSSNPSILPNPTINYSTGKKYGYLTYNAAIVGTVLVSVTATNFGAPTNSNGNSSITRIFTINSKAPPLSGYIELFTSPGVISAPNDGVQNLTINTSNGVVTNVMNKPGTAPLYFSGIWYEPPGGNLFNFKVYPYLSVNLSTTNTAGKVAIDLWDVNNVRYGLSSEQIISTSPTTYTYCFNGVPSPGFDFSKVKAVLFNFGVTTYHNGTGNWDTYSGTFTMSNLRLGNSAQGSGSCPGNTSTVLLGEVSNPYHLSTQPGSKSVTITGVNAGSNPITGNNNNPVNIAVSGGLGANLISYNPSTGTAVIGYTTTAATGSTVITLNASATGSTPTVKTFTVNVQNTPAATNLIVTNDLTANMTDGQKGQTIDGSPFGVCEIFGTEAANFDDTYYEKLAEANVQSMRIGIYDFEPVNDNSDPNVLDKSKLDYNAMQVEFFKKASDAGVTRFLATFFSPPNFTKYNREAGVPAPPAGYILTNTIDSAYYKEYAEYAVAFVQGVKEKSGVDIYGLSIGNEIQFNQTYQSVVLNTQQYVEIIRAIGRRFAQEGIKTFLWGAETLQAQDGGNSYMKECQKDAEVRNYFAGYAVHSYAADGVGAGGPSTGNWAQILADSRDTRSNGGLTAVRNSLVATLGPNGEPHNGNGGTGIPVHQTETSQGGLPEGAFPSWQNAMDVFGAVTSSLNYGNVSGWYYIGLALDADLYYTYKHIDKYVFGGARRVPASSPAGTSSSAFRNPDNSLTIVIGNDNTSMRNISITGTNMPSAFKAYMSVDNLFWQDLGTVTGSMVMPPNSLVTLWGGGNALVAANGVTVTGTSGATTINAAGGTLQMTAMVDPSNLVDKSVTWSVIAGTGSATISQSGLVTANTDGTVTVRATSNATPAVYGERQITISGQVNIPLVSLTLTTSGSSMNAITAPAGGIVFIPVFNPGNTTQQSIGWSISGDQTIASITSNGYLQATNYGNGVLTVTATSLSNATITSSVVVSISGQNVAISGVTITGSTNVITVNNGTLQLNKIVAPINTLPGITWISSNNLIATVDVINGLVSAKDNGVITITAFVGAPSTVTSSYIISVSGQQVKSISITLSNPEITTPNGTVQLTPAFLPVNAEGRNIIWSISTTSLAGVSQSGLVMAANYSNFSNGVTVTGTVANTTISSSVVIPIRGQRFATYYSLNSSVTSLKVDVDPTLFIYRVKPGVSSTILTIDGLGMAYGVGNGSAVFITMLAADTSLRFERAISISDQNTSLGIAVSNELGGDIIEPIVSVGGVLFIQPTLLPNKPNLSLSEFLWTADPSDKLTFDGQGSATAIHPGIVVVKVTYLKNPLLNSSVTVTVLGISNLADYNDEHHFSLYPNPTKGVISIKLNSLQAGNIAVYNSLGNMILSKKVGSDLKFDLTGFPIGLYTVVFSGDNVVYKRKITLE